MSVGLKLRLRVTGDALQKGSVTDIAPGSEDANCQGRELTSHKSRQKLEDRIHIRLFEDYVA